MQLKIFGVGMGYGFQNVIINLFKKWIFDSAVISV